MTYKNKKNKKNKKFIKSSKNKKCIFRKSKASRKRGGMVPLLRDLYRVYRDPTLFPKKEYPNGDRYDGDLNNNGNPHGRGKMTYANKNVYEGNWENGLKSGYGIMKIMLVNNIIPLVNIKYEGNWENGELRNGIITDYDGNRHTGEWRPKTIYEGDIENNIPNGQGTMTFFSMFNNSISKYVGNWGNGLRNGQGTMTYYNGNKYVGNWENNFPDGFGTMTYANGEIYAGEWENGEETGDKLR